MICICLTSNHILYSPFKCFQHHHFFLVLCTDHRKKITKSIFTPRFSWHKEVKAEQKKHKTNSNNRKESSKIERRNRWNVANENVPWFFSSLACNEIHSCIHLTFNICIRSFLLVCTISPILFVCLFVSHYLLVRMCVFLRRDFKWFGLFVWSFFFGYISQLLFNFHCCWCRWILLPLFSFSNFMISVYYTIWYVCVNEYVVCIQRGALYIFFSALTFN